MMKCIALSVVVLGSVRALPQLVPRAPDLFSDPISDLLDPHPWQAPSPNDIRAPCPGFNTLANHGYINRDGRNVTIDAIRHGFLEAFGMAFDVTTPGAINTMNLCTSRLPRGSPECTSTNIDILDIPHAIEHDGSMRTNDKGVNGGRGNNHDFSPAIMAETKNIWGSNTHMNYDLSETVRLRRFEQQRRVDDRGWFRQNDGGSLSEQAFTLSTMSDPDPLTGGDPGYGNARIDWVEYWYENARLPTQLGWVKPVTTIYQGQIGSIMDELQSATTIPADTATTTSDSSSSGFTSPPLFPLGNAFNPYQDIQSPDDWNELLFGVGEVPEDIVDGVLDILDF